MQREKSRLMFEITIRNWVCSFIFVLVMISIRNSHCKSLSFLGILIGDVEMWWIWYVLQGHLDVELNDAGRQQAVRVCVMFLHFNILRFDCAVTLNLDDDGDAF